MSENQVSAAAAPDSAQWWREVAQKLAIQNRDLLECLEGIAETLDKMAPCPEDVLDQLLASAQSSIRAAKISSVIHERESPELNTLSTGFNVKIVFHSNEAHDKIKSETFVREKIGAILDTHGVQEEIDYTLEVRRLYE